MHQRQRHRRQLSVYIHRTQLDYYGSIQLLRPERRMNECGKVGGVEYRADMTTA